MDDFVYVVSLAGKHVPPYWGVVYVIKRMKDLDKVRDIIKKHYDIVFEDRSSCFTFNWWKFINITDDRDINLVVERVKVLD